MRIDLVHHTLKGQTTAAQSRQDTLEVRVPQGLDLTARAGRRGSVGADGDHEPTRPPRGGAGATMPAASGPAHGTDCCPETTSPVDEPCNMTYSAGGRNRGSSTQRRRRA